jgi:hypothetical protein
MYGVAEKWMRKKNGHVYNPASTEQAIVNPDPRPFLFSLPSITMLNSTDILSHSIIHVSE